jgi:hypothetical protein
MSVLAYQKTEKQTSFGFDAFDDGRETNHKIVAQDMSFIEVFDELNRQLDELKECTSRDALKAKQILLHAKANLIKNFKQ